MKTGTAEAARRRAALLCGALAAAFVLLGQGLTVRYNYQGDWSALFNHGALYPAARELAWEHQHRFPETLGYDGQLYHLVAHDPFLRHGLARYVDAPRLRYRRVLVPLAAYALVVGRQHLIDVAYRGVVLLFVFLGAYWCAAYAALVGHSAAWGLAFLVVPAVVVSADRMTVDVALAALTAGCALWARRASAAPAQAPRRAESCGITETRAATSSWPLYAALALAALARETGALLVLASCLTAVARRRFRAAALALAMLLPAVAWYAFVHVRTEAYHYHNSYVPLGGIVKAFVHPAPTPFVRPGQVAEWWRLTLMGKPLLDRLALVGAVVGFGLAFWSLRRGAMDFLAVAASLFALTGVFVQRSDNWLHVYDYGRVYSPLLLLLALRGLEESSAWRAAPLTLMWPRIAVELAMQAVGIVRGLAQALALS